MLALLGHIDFYFFAGFLSNIWLTHTFIIFDNFFNNNHHFFLQKMVELVLLITEIPLKKFHPNFFYF